MSHRTYRATRPPDEDANRANLISMQFHYPLVKRKKDDSALEGTGKAVIRIPVSVRAKEKLFWTAEDIHSLDYASDLGLPGSVPFTRGCEERILSPENISTSLLLSGRHAELKRVIPYAQQAGISSFSFELDPFSRTGGNGRFEFATRRPLFGSVRCDSLSDFSFLVENAGVENFLGFDATFSGSMLYSMLDAYLRGKGLKWNAVRGYVLNDFLSDIVLGMKSPLSVSTAMDLLASVIFHSFGYGTAFTPLVINSCSLCEAGTGADMEVGLSMMNFITYVGEMIARNVNAEDMAERVAFLMGSSMDVPVTIAKLRAFRRLYYREVHRLLPELDDRKLCPRVILRTSRANFFNSTAEVNLVRSGVQAAGALLGGADFIQFAPVSRAEGMREEDVMRALAHIPFVLTYENALQDTSDPVGGAYYIEELTDRIEKEARSFLRKYDSSEFINAVESGSITEETERRIRSHDEDIENGRILVVEGNILTSGVKRGALRRQSSARPIRRSALRSERLAEALSSVSGIMDYVPVMSESFSKGATLHEVVQSFANLS